MEQDQPVRRDEPLTARPLALLLAAHGERRPGAGNAGVVRLAKGLAARGAAAEVAVGFIKGTPAVGEAIRAFSSPEVVVYPLFLSDGYFTRVVLPRLLDEVRHQDRARRMSILPPLGLDPALADLIEEEAAAAAQSRGVAPENAVVILLAHGSTTDPASRTAAEQLAERVRGRCRFRETRVALLEESPTLGEAIAGTRGPVVAVGLFAGEGMHGVGDMKRLITDIGRDDIVSAGLVGTFAGIEAVVAAAVARHAHPRSVGRPILRDGRCAPSSG